MAEESKKSSGAAGVVGAVVGQIVLGAVCVAAGWVGKDIFEKNAPRDAAANPAAAAAGLPKTVAVTNAVMKAYNLPERFVAHAEPVQEVELLPQVDGYIVEMIELPDHPWFVATQAHPEFKSRPLAPHPLFRDFVAAAKTVDL